jgi:hypothetical protein
MSDQSWALQHGTNWEIRVLMKWTELVQRDQYHDMYMYEHERTESFEIRCVYGDSGWYMRR